MQACIAIYEKVDDKCGALKNAQKVNAKVVCDKETAQSLFKKRKQAVVWHLTEPALQVLGFGGAPGRGAREWDLTQSKTLWLERARPIGQGRER